MTLSTLNPAPRAGPSPGLAREGSPDGSPAATTPQAWRWTPVLIGLAAWGLSNMDQSFFGYAVPGLMKSFGFGLPQIGGLISASFLFSMLIATLAGALTDVYGPRWTLPTCLALSAVFVGLQGLAESAAAFSVLRIVGYGFSGALSPITNAMVSNAAPPRGRPMAIAILQCGYPLGWFGASLLAAPILPHWGWRGVFAAAFAVVPLALVFILAIPPQPRAAGPTVPRPAKSVVGPVAALFSRRHQRRTLQVAAALMLYGGAIGGMSFYLPSFFQETRGYSASLAAQIVGLSYGVGVIGYVGSAYVCQTFLSRRRTVALWLALGMVFLSALLSLHWGVVADMVLFSLTAIFLFGSSAILIIYLLELFPADIRSSAAAVSGTSAIGLGFVIFPVLTGALAVHLGWTLTFAVLVLPAVLGSGLLMTSVPPLETPGPEAS